MHKTFKYKAKPTREQEKLLGMFLRQSRDLYNAGLEERIWCHGKTGKGLSKFDQMKSLTVIRREDPDYGRECLQWQRGALIRLDRAFDGFFRRCKSGAKPGFPKFKGSHRWNSLIFPEGRGYQVTGNRFRFKGMDGGGLKFIKSRPIPAGAKKTGAVIKRDACGDWWLCISVELPDVPKIPVEKAIGVDVGLEKFLVDSDGNSMPNPRFLRKAEGELARKQRQLARAKKGSNSRAKKKLALAKCHRKITRQRSNFHWQVAWWLCRKAELIAVEDLNVKGMAMSGMNGMSKSVSDASWSQFIGILSWLAEKSGREVVSVDARGTSQRCSGCGDTVRKELSARAHECPECGLVLDRDWNAAVNILRGAGMAPVARSASAGRKTTEVSECPVVTEYMRKPRQGYFCI